MKINITHVLSDQAVKDILATQGKMASETTYDVCKRFVRTAVKDASYDMHHILEEDERARIKLSRTLWVENSG